MAAVAEGAAAMAKGSSSLHFPVRRCKAVLVSPAKSTPYEFKQLSAIDEQDGLQLQARMFFFYANHINPFPSSVIAGRSVGSGREVGEIIRDAVSKALVYYYPLAGRIRESSNGKLIVECNGEGLSYIEAEADVKLEQLGESIIQSPSLRDQLLYENPEESKGILNSPILLIQVTRLLCGGFIFAIRLNHAMADGKGVAQFMSAVAEIARGAKAPSILPVWEREAVKARDPPCPLRVRSPPSCTIVNQLQAAAY